MMFYKCPRHLHQMVCLGVRVGDAADVFQHLFGFSYKIVAALMETRASEAEELTGLDIVEHGERGYARSVMTGSPMLGSFEDSSEMLANTVMSINAQKG